MMHTLWKRAIIESVPVEGNPNAWNDIVEALGAMGVVFPGETLLEYREDRDFVRMGGESYGASFTVTVKDAAKRFVVRPVYAKALIVGFGEAGTLAAIRTQIERLRILSGWGILTPLVYGHGTGTIYEEFISGPAPDPSGHPSLEGMARIAAILDLHGARPLSFLEDLMMDDRRRLRYVDAGFDLGHIQDGLPPDPDRPALRTLLTAAGDRAPSAAEAYERQYLIITMRQGG